MEAGWKQMPNAKTHVLDGIGHWSDYRVEWAVFVLLRGKYAQ